MQTVVLSQTGAGITLRRELIAARTNAEALFLKQFAGEVLTAFEHEQHCVCRFTACTLQSPAASRHSSHVSV